MNKTKYQMAKLIAGGCIYPENPSYEDLLEAIYEQNYRAILKVPTNILLLGTIQSFVLNDLEHANKLLQNLKEVVKDALEVSGVELTYTDEDWENLKLIENPTQWGSKYILSIDTENKYVTKGYMSAFFEYD